MEKTNHDWQLLGETHVVDLGFGDDIFNANYDLYSSLSSDSWFKHIWCLCWRFRVKLYFHEDNNPAPIREGDVALMDLFRDSEVFDLQQLQVLQRYRHYKKAFYFSDVVTCDGRSISQFAQQPIEGLSKKVYPHERPRKKDHKLWISALKMISSPNMTLDRPLGRFLSLPTSLDEWYLHPQTDTLYNQMHTVIILYEKVAGGITRATSKKYKYSKRVDSIPPSTLLATVDRQSSDPEIVSLHSTAARPLAPVPVLTFTEALEEYNTPSLWKHMLYSTDPDEWLYNSICNGTTVVVHDGSYMPKMTTEVCSAAVIICDKESGEWLSCVIAEKSSSADNYRGEILGGVMALLLIKAATTGRVEPDYPLNCHCDNMGVVKHAHHPDWTLRENQAQADVLSLMKHITTILSTTVKYHHVKSHQLKHKTFEQLDYISQKNELCDVMAKEHLIYAFLEGDCISDNFPYEQVVFEVDNEKVTSSPTKSIHKYWSFKTARALYHNKKKMHKDHFDLIYWHGMGKVMREYPRMFRV